MKNAQTIRYPAVFALLIIIIVASASCSKDNNPYGGNTSGNNGGQPGANEVWIQGMAFNPSSITVAAGTTIKWTNKDAIAHTVTANDNSFDSGNIPANGTFSHTFSSAGTISYYCKIHPGMKGSVMVQ